VYLLDDVYEFQQQQCKCKKDKCSTKRCHCRKNDRLCDKSRCDCGPECQNCAAEQPDDEESEESAGEGSSSVMSASAGAESSSDTGVQMQCQEATYDPTIHNATWHNDNPFALERYRRKLKKCRGCGSEFIRRSEPEPKFVISHEERREFWSIHGRKVSSQKAFYHCSSSCLSPRHPYFKPREVTAAPPVARKLTKEDDRLIQRHGIKLSFIRRTEPSFKKHATLKHIRQV